MRSPVLKFVAMTIASLALASCMTTATYRPADAGEGTAGYAETRLTDAAWRVEFLGDDSTSREVVETYLLYRSAELTLQNGYDWFASSETHISEETEVIVEAPRFADYRARYWRPNWRRHDRFFRSDLDPVGPIPPEPRDARVWTNERYSATTDIHLGRGPMPVGAFDARETLNELGPSIRRPQA